MKDFQPVEIHPMFSISFGKTYGSYLFSVKFLTGALSGADSSILEHTADASQWRRVRGYYFKTDINELTVSAKRFYGPLFLSVGGGAYYTQNIEPVLTYGGGIRLGIVQLTIEGRKLFTDYLDGVSDKPYSKGDDSYVSVMIGIVLRKRKINDWECPKWE